MAKGVGTGIALVIALIAVQFTAGFLIIKYLGESYLLVESPLFMIIVAVSLKLLYRNDDAS
jgi:hypothetical protein